MKKEFLISLLIFIPLATVLSYINYNSLGNNLTKAIAGGCVGALGVFIVPYFIKKFKSNQK
jgi:hypothetical protein